MEKELSLNMTLYEANKNIMKTVKPVAKKRMELDLANMSSWMATFLDTRYFMLMCKERSDFSLIHLINMNYSAAVQEIKEILEERGTLLAINYVKEENYYECWVRQEAENPNESEVFMFALFDADWMVVDIL